MFITYEYKKMNLEYIFTKCFFYIGIQQGVQILFQQENWWKK